MRGMELTRHEAAGGYAGDGDLSLVDGERLGQFIERCGVAWNFVPPMRHLADGAE
jgi:hypothetical protein